jgi:hypothetical protein
MTINNNFVAVPAQSKSLDTNTITTAAGVVHRQVVSLASADTTGTYLGFNSDSAKAYITNTVAISASSLPLPTGASTSALQTTGNSSLSSIDTKTATLVGGKVPVVLPTNAATDTLQTSGNASLTAIDSKLGGTLTVNVGLTDTQLRATAVPVTVSGVSTAALQTTGNSSLSSIDSKITAVNTGAVIVSSSALPTGASTSALQTAGNNSLSSIDGKTPALVSGRQPVDGSGVIQPISATDVTATGSIASNGASVVLAIVGQASYAVQVTGTWVGTLQFEGSVDGVNYTPLVVRLAGTSTYIINATTNAIYRGNCSAYKNIRVISIAWTSGTASIAIGANMAVGGVFINSEVRPKSTDVVVTSTAAAAAGVTLTLPAAGAGLFHYITKLEVSAIASAARTAAATPVIVTTTNFSGSLAFSFQANAAAQGVSERQVNDFDSPLKSSVANTATTIVAPATTSVIWRVTAYYYTAA